MALLELEAANFASAHMHRELRIIQAESPLALACMKHVISSSCENQQLSDATIEPSEDQGHPNPSLYIFQAAIDSVQENEDKEPFKSLKVRLSKYMEFLLSRRIFEVNV